MSSLLSFGQDDIVIIDKELYEESRRSPRLNDNIQIVKFSPTQLIMGELNFGYERQVSKKGSIEIEAGPTLSQVSILGPGNHLFSFAQGSAQENSFIGGHISFSYRFYPLDGTEALNRLYVAPVIKYRQYNVLLRDNSDVPNGPDLGTVKARDYQTNFTFNFGYELWASKSFCFDFFVGTGLGWRHQTTYAPVIEFNGTEWTGYWAGYNDAWARFLLTGGVKLGIGSKGRN